MAYLREFVEHIYEIVEGEFDGFDAIYEDCIVDLVGNAGLNALRMHKYVETCGVINGRQLYVLCKK